MNLGAVSVLDAFRLRISVQHLMCESVMLGCRVLSEY